MKKSIRIGGGIAEFFGTHDGNVKYLESLLRVQLQIKDDTLTIDGADEHVDLVERMIADYVQLRAEGVKLSNADLKSVIRIISEDATQSLRGVVTTTKQVVAGKRSLTPKTLNQKLYLEAIEKNDLVFGIGPAGTGKTYLAVSMAVRALTEKKVNRIVLTRPAVEAGERLGFLPGTLQEKIDPYLKPLYDALYDMLDVERVDRHLERGAIEIAPIAFMRGRTLNDSFIILDEAQNTTAEQMKMLLTRIGYNTKIVVTGDVTQIDLPAGKMSGLIEAEKIICGVEGTAFVHFNDRDVVRHPLVQRIVRAYEAYSIDGSARQQPLRFGPGDEARPRNSPINSMKSKSMGSPRRDTGEQNRLVLNKQRKHAVDTRSVREFLSELVLQQNKQSMSLSVVLIDDEAMRTYNRKYRGFDKPTDVLSFRGDDDYLGDILISVQTASAQACKSRSLTLETNIRRLALHGFLHLTGYDHETDNGEMRAIERRLRRRFQC